jgi:hypothetical protein
MPDPLPPSRIDYGESLLSPGRKQPTGVVHVDAFGLAQAQLTFATDSSPANLKNIVSYYSPGVAYPDDLGFAMKSYKVSISSSEGGLAMVVVDYMGISRAGKRTDAQVSGICNTQAQPIETHPNFTVVTDDTIGTGSPTQILAGAPAYPSTNPNHPIFAPPASVGAPWQFLGFGLPADGTRNKKAGVRQYLRPMPNFRGQIFFDPEKKSQAQGLVESIGDVLQNGDLDVLLNPIAAGSSAWLSDRVLLTAANIECIGTPANPCAFKVTYDLMVGGDFGWDFDIYGRAAVLLS